MQGTLERNKLRSMKGNGKLKRGKISQEIHDEKKGYEYRVGGLIQKLTGKNKAW